MALNTAADEPATPPSPPPVEAPATMPEPVPAPAPERGSRSQPGEGLRLPSETRDLSFLEGCWESTSRILEAETSTPVEIRYCFQNNGRGTVEISKSDGAHCTAPIRAQRIGPNLKMRHGAIPCDRGSGFNESIITCKPLNNEASCDVINYRNRREERERVIDGRFRRVE